MPKTYSELEKDILDVLESGVKTANELSEKLEIPLSTLIDNLNKLISEDKLSKYTAPTAKSSGGRPPVYFGKPENIKELKNNDPAKIKILDALEQPRNLDYLVEALELPRKTLNRILKCLIAEGKIASHKQPYSFLYFGRPEQISELMEKPSELESQLLAALENPLTRDQLIKSLELPRTTIFDSLKKLLLKNDVVAFKYNKPNATRGRHKVYFLGAEKANKIKDIKILAYNWQ